ncbi:MAG: anthranilate phosphoribosyltransferase family protein [Cyanobacteria bacterium]|nr:anthranilate phosphoribosyltransferase family protein [Cyanobacteriota bacterium]MDA0864890.1 anthranilate phosphoribosyltransferase family protein [Cyanobacteriota bacterium]
MSQAFRDILKKVGSGSHTSQPLSRDEAAEAGRMMLSQTATPAQIGAFLIAHRIKRPTAPELAGLLDAYGDLGPMMMPIDTEKAVTIFGCPYDGRSRTAPIIPITALLLATAGIPVLLHGGDRMPTKEGLPLIEIWRSLGLPLDQLSLNQARQLLQETGFGFVYLPQHFPLAQGIVEYREQIGKRPPLATIELFWCPYGGNAHVVSGYVHPPTEELAKGTFAQQGREQFTLVKGLEGSCDLPRSRAAIVGVTHGDGRFEHLLLHAGDHGLSSYDLPLDDETAYLSALPGAIAGQPSELLGSALWNGGFYLWRLGYCDTFSAGIAEAKRLLKEGQVQAKLAEIRQVLGQLKAPSAVLV